ncbi:serine hydrolase [Streptantibioticus cattleyicolor]|uniref:D-alanyl-D-alanine carboxypeptidase n=1 Tax=Streptantibioticus cattleyicolor (strain ATCC 35852 / DSM 46488 / JCM 4925 / NBRC 14057 / NRRL 8057) TaxID=1003195 RepID=F8JIW3_STREN
MAGGSPDSSERNVSAETAPEPNAPTAPDTGADTGAASRPTDASADEPPSEENAEPAPDPMPEPDSGTGTPSEPEPEAEAEPEPEAGTDDAPEPDVEADADADAEDTSAPDADTEDTPDPDTDTNTEDASTPEPTPAADPEPEPNSTPEPEPTSHFVPLKPLDEPRGERVAEPVGAEDEGRPAPEPLGLFADVTVVSAAARWRAAARRPLVWAPLVVVLVVMVAFVVARVTRPLPAPVLSQEVAKGYTFPGSYRVPWPAGGQGAAEVVGVGSLGGTGAGTPVPTASTAKVMTAYVVLKDHPLRGGDQGPRITVDELAEKQATAPGESTVYLTKGQVFTEYQMLQMLMLNSGNNVARLLARWDGGGDQRAFVAKMNAEAKALGMADTVYTDPSGLDATTRSTPADQVRLAGEVMRDDVFRRIVATTDATVDGLAQPLSNTNTLLRQDPGVKGIKTGNSSAAHGAFVWAAYRTVAGRPWLVLGALMEQRSPLKGVDSTEDLRTALANSKAVIDSIGDHLTAATVVKKGQVVGDLDDGMGGRVAVVAASDLTVAGWPGLELRVSVDAGRVPLPHSAKAGTRVGTITVGTGSAAHRVPAQLAADLHAPSFGTRLFGTG